MFTIHGTGIGGGIAIGNAYLIDKTLENVSQHHIEAHQVNDEIARFNQALFQTKLDLETLRANVPSQTPAELSAFLSLAIMMLSDSHIAKEPIKIISNELCGAEWAIKLQADRLSKKFDDMEDLYLKERKFDILQIFEKIFKNLVGSKIDFTDLNLKNAILVAHDISPADLIGFKNADFCGFLTEVGNLTSHMVIIGRNLEIPAIVGVQSARQIINDNDVVIIDGVAGVIVVNPDELVLNEYKERQLQWLFAEQKLFELSDSKAITKDGVEIQLYANIDCDNDVSEVIKTNAHGIGLFRSEFLFLANENHFCSEEEQYIIYSNIAKQLKSGPLIIRTADFGSDKNPSWNNQHNKDSNPALGLNGIRLCLAQDDFFQTQLRAILRASAHGDIQIMFPMISSSWELKQAISKLELVKQDLLDKGVSFNYNIKVGIMIEVPSAALTIKSIIKMVDFISIGTNDLIQYLLAMDRNNEAVSYLYNPLHHE